MTDKRARELAICNYRERKSDLEEDAYDSGCHGIIGEDDEESLLNRLISDYLRAIAGKNVVKQKRRQSTPRGYYINSPQWN